MYYFHGRLVIAFRHRTAQLHKSETILSHPWRITLHPSGKCKKKKIERYAKLLQEESESNTKDTSLKDNFLASALSLFLIDIIRWGDWEEAGKLNVNSDPHRTYWLFVDLIEKNFAKHHSVKFYTEALSISQTTLAAHTQQYAKTSPLKLINDRIILEAKRMIRYSDLRIKEIAFDLGFKDDSYFAKLFKRNVGMSPVEFREKREIAALDPWEDGYKERPPGAKRALPLGPGGLIVFLIKEETLLLHHKLLAVLDINILGQMVHALAIRQPCSSSRRGPWLWP